MGQPEPRARWGAIAASFAVGLLAVLLPAHAVGAEGAPHAAGPFTEPATAEHPARDYLLFSPSPSAPVAPSSGRPLLVLLHGCTQTAADVELGSRMSQAAEARGWVVAYPQQAAFTNEGTAVDGNGGSCWNWFLPANEHRGAGEPGTIAAITHRIVDGGGIDASRVYVAGISAGADMATAMGVTYPDLYAAVGHIAGCAYSQCGDVTGELTVAEMGPRARQVPTMLVQGSTDEVNNVAMGETSLQQWLGADDLIDDGLANGSVSHAPARTDSYVPPADPTAPGDPCVYATRFPCAGGAVGFQGSYPFTVDHFETAAGGTLVDRWLIQGVGHAWPGGDPAGTFTDPLGPDITNALLNFFDENPMAADAQPVVPEGAPLALLAAGALIAAGVGVRRIRGRRGEPPHFEQLLDGGIGR
jgi:poly(hydroxyalkanoate) depolymerase family esterase